MPPRTKGSFGAGLVRCFFRMPRWEAEMAAFSFVKSLDGSPVDVPESTRRGVYSALRERSPGLIQEHNQPGVWASLSGPLGDLTVSDGNLLLCDGAPETVGGTGGRYLIQELVRGGTAFGGTDVGGDLDFGVQPLQSVVGSFAACYHDGLTGEVILIRDRLGTRPLFFAEWEGRLLVASECKALQALGLPLEVDPFALREALIYRWVTGEACLLAPAVRVPEAHVVRIRLGHRPLPRRYWRLRVEPEPLDDGAFVRYQDEVEIALRTCLGRVGLGSRRVGLLLSGGVDSSILAALGREELDSCVAYSGWIEGFNNVEFERARTVAGHLGVEFRAVAIDSGVFRHDLPYIVRRIEELPRHLNNLGNLCTSRFQ